MIFQINGRDYTKYLQDDSYNVVQEDNGKIWTDANYKKHKHSILKIQGSFNLVFVKDADYSQFLSDLSNSKNANGYYVCTPFVLNLNISQTIECFIKTSSKQFRPVDSNTVVNIITVNIEEA